MSIFKTKKFTLVTDGCCLSQSSYGTGGWANVIIQDNIKRESYGGIERSNNLEAEMRAIIEGLNYLPEQSEIMLITDRDDVPKLLDWAKTSKNAQNWGIKSRIEIRNTLMDAVKRHATVKVEVRRSHSSSERHPEQETAHKLARRGADEMKKKMELSEKTPAPKKPSAYHAYIAGASYSNKRGAYAAVIIAPNGIERIISGAHEQSNVLEMKMRAIIKALKNIPSDSAVVLVTDEVTLEQRIDKIKSDPLCADARRFPELAQAIKECRKLEVELRTKHGCDPKTYEMTGLHEKQLLAYETCRTLKPDEKSRGSRDNTPRSL